MKLYLKLLFSDRQLQKKHFDVALRKKHLGVVDLICE